MIMKDEGERGGRRSARGGGEQHPYNANICLLLDHFVPGYDENNRRTRTILELFDSRNSIGQLTR